MRFRISNLTRCERHEWRLRGRERPRRKTGGSVIAEEARSKRLCSREYVLWNVIGIRTGIARLVTSSTTGSKVASRKTPSSGMTGTTAPMGIVVATAAAVATALVVAAHLLTKWRSAKLLSSWWAKLLDENTNIDTYAQAQFRRH